MQKNREYYKSLVKQTKDYKSMTKSFLQAFFFGGLVCLFGQILLVIYNNFFDFKQSSLLLSVTMILIAALLTCIGIYDEIGQIAKCGLAIPITGFSNACTCAAMEYHKEGIVTGVGANCLKLAGSVIVLGTSSAIIVASLRYVLEVLL